MAYTQHYQTVHYAFTTLATVANNTFTAATTFSPLTVTLIDIINNATPGTQIVGATLRFSADDVATSGGGAATSLTTKRFDITLNAAAALSTTNNNSFTIGGENYSLFWDIDCTSYFQTNWTGGANTVGLQVQLNSNGGGTTGFVNACATLIITYYSTLSVTPGQGSTSHQKSVWIPLDAPTGALGTVSAALANVQAVAGGTGQFTCNTTTLAVGQCIGITGTLTGTATISSYANTAKVYRISATNGTTSFTLTEPNGQTITTTAGTTTGLTFTPNTYDYIPALDTYLPESSKTYRNIHLVFQANEQKVASTTDRTLTLRIGTASVTTGNYEASNSSDRFIRYVWNLTSAYPSTAAVQAFQPTSTVAGFNHFQAWLVVTYEYNWTTTTSVLNSIVLPFGTKSPMVANTGIDYTKATIPFSVQEPSPVLARLAAYVFWSSTDPISPLYLSLDPSVTSFITYTDLISSTALSCGTNAAMIRDDVLSMSSALAQGYTRDTSIPGNFVVVSAYKATESLLGSNFSGFVVINYTSNVAGSSGDIAVGKTADHNRTIWHSVLGGFSTAAAATSRAAVPVSEWRLSTDYYYMLSNIGIEYLYMLSGTTGNFGVTLQNFNIGSASYIDYLTTSVSSDPETGAFFMYNDLTWMWLQYSEFDLRPLHTGNLGYITRESYSNVIVRSSATSAVGHDSAFILATVSTITFTITFTIRNTGGIAVYLYIFNDRFEPITGYPTTGDGNVSITLVEGYRRHYAVVMDAAGLSSGILTRGISESFIPANVTAAIATLDASGGVTYFAFS